METTLPKPKSTNIINDLPDLSKPKRAMSIDALRGFDMLMIIGAGSFFVHLDRAANTPVTGFIAEQFRHPEWYGFHFYDIIMPLFLFMVGAVIPFSLSKRKQETSSKKSLYRHLIKRFIILFILGWIVQGHLLELDLNTFAVFSNTLQAIAVGYIFSALAYMHLKPIGRYITFVACLILYALVLTVPEVPGAGRSVLLPDANFAIYFDRWIFGELDDGTQYTWLLSGIGFIATTLSGVFAGEMIRSNRSGPKIALNLLVIGICFCAAGLIWGIWHPIVKKIWSSSFVLFSSGLSFILLSLFYWIIDVKGYKKWAYPLKIIGMNAIVAYVLSHIISFSSIADSILFGLKQFVGEYHNAIITAGGFFILYLILWYMYKNKTFIKI